jgi:omega-hydroxy-beta-dihydromenaquinone-9 sulfotransferase
MEQDRRCERGDMHHFLYGGGIGDFGRLLWRNGGASAANWGKCGALAGAMMARSPFSLGQRILFERAISSAELHPAPLFILGHWRSGTTFLHELLSRSGDFTYLNYLQALLPWDFLGEERGWRFLLRLGLPARRPMDEVRIHADAPAEDGLALANMGTLSMYHAFVFPARMREIFRQAVLFEGGPLGSLSLWKERYRYLLRKMSLGAPGRRLLLKDPAHTAHIPLLLDMFPRACFVTIERDKDEVLASMLRMCRALCRAWALQRYDESALEIVVPWMYEEVMRRYREDRGSIPPGRLMEVKLEQLATEPDKIVRLIREELEVR